LVVKWHIIVLTFFFNTVSQLFPKNKKLYGLSWTCTHQLNQIRFTVAAITMAMAMLSFLSFLLLFSFAPILTFSSPYSLADTKTSRDRESYIFELWQWRRLYLLLLILHRRYIHVLWQLEYCHRLHLSYFIAVVSAKLTILPNSNLLETSPSEPLEIAGFVGFTMSRRENLGFWVCLLFWFRNSYEMMSCK